uniref:Photosystem I reaction center subunit III n=1 Tax=Ophidocladus simpliciusculus TaxID=1261574 RepID=A0A1Z1MIJ9_9FLOR|nr:photosystem I reaction center subunit III [Ophidocladus simpliciusculus]ARW65900.1 photosystem I reaction center subunit III [Ophidocladus simpliciusculus]
MRKIALILLTFLILLSTSNVSYADVAGLTPCKDSPAFNKRLKSAVKKLETRLSKYEPSTPPALAIQNQIKQTQVRFSNYSNSGILCGSEGLPHLISDGRWNHAGEFMLPGILFIYITGWIGWVGRSYLRAVSSMNKPTEKEIIIDVPLAMKFSLSGFTWPLAALQELTSGQLLAENDDISISPR